ncbi:MAG: thioesterase family protein [Nitriliruptorales bacterium]
MGFCDPGLSASHRVTVTENDTAIAMGSGDVPVLATPRVLALAESTCVAAVAGDVPEGKTTVGAYAEVEHMLPSPVGSQVEVEATLIGHHGRRLEFNVTFRQNGEPVATVQHRRVVVDREYFLGKLPAAS